VFQQVTRDGFVLISLFGGILFMKQQEGQENGPAYDRDQDGRFLRPDQLNRLYNAHLRGAVDFFSGTENVACPVKCLPRGILISHWGLPCEVRSLFHWSSLAIFNYSEPGIDNESNSFDL
jgi:hypothetical protein